MNRRQWHYSPLVSHSFSTLWVVRLLQAHHCRCLDYRMVGGPRTENKCLQCLGGPEKQKLFQLLFVVWGPHPEPLWTYFWLMLRYLSWWGLRISSWCQGLQMGSAGGKTSALTLYFPGPEYLLSSRFLCKSSPGAKNL